MERTVHYRSVDPIQNLKLRVKLYCRSGSSTDPPTDPPPVPAKEGTADKAGEPKSSVLSLIAFWKGKNAEGKENEGGGEQDEGDKAEQPVQGGDTGEGVQRGADGEEVGGDDERGEEERATEGGKGGVGGGGGGKRQDDSWDRCIGWQEKLFSSWEVMNALKDQQPDATLSPRKIRESKAGPERTRSMRSLANASLLDSYKKTIMRGIRGSAEAFSDSRIFTYVNADEYTERSETERKVSTSEKEHLNPLAMALYSQPRGSNRVLRYQTMYVMADCGEKDGERLEKVLVAIKSYADGSFDMRPGFNRVDTDGTILEPYEFEDENGAQWSFTVTNAAKTDATKEENRVEELTKWHKDRARVVRNAVANQMFERAPGPSPDALRFVLMAEIVAAKDFKRDKLWVEYDIRYDPAIWGVKPEPSEAGHLQGCTHVSTCTLYPGEPGRGILPHYVAHFSHPIEFEFFAQEDPKASQWPSMCFQVNTYDNWDRYTVEGYTHLSLNTISRGGCAVHRLTTWKPLGSVVDRLNSFFIGGSAELKDITYSGVPQGFNGKYLSKFGFKAETSGVLKIRTSAILQQRRAAEDDVRVKAVRTSMARVSIARKDTERKREMLTLAMVVARARRRVEAARGGPVVARGEVLEAMTEPPVIVKDTAPEYWEADEGGSAGFSVKVTGTRPIQYQWYKNGKLLRVTTATASLLSLQNVQMVDAGEYHCVATNADGEVTSRIARLVVSAALGFVEHPDKYVKCEEGETARIKVEAKGKPPLEYNWFKDQKELNFDESCTSRVLVLSKVAPTDSGYYHCVISNGTDDEESEKCQLVVTAGTAPKKPAGGSKGEAAESGLSPHSNGDDEGNDDGGEESGRDDGEMSRPSEVKSGRRNGDGGRSGTEEKEGGRSKGDDGKVKAHAMKPSSPQTSGDDASSDHTRVTHDDAGSDGGGDAITEEPLPPPVVTAHPASAGVQEDESVEFRVSATGSGLAFQWLHNGEAVPNETEATLALLRAGKEHVGEYVCEVTGAGGASVRSDVAKLEVRGRQKNTADDVQAIGDDDDDLEQISA